MSNKNSIKNEKKIEEVIKIANDILRKYKRKISKKNLDLSLYNAGYFDSLDFVTFIGSLEKKLKMKFKISDLDVNLSIKKIIKLIR